MSTSTPSVSREQHKKNIVKQLRAREHKTLKQIADAIEGDVTVKHLVRAMAELVQEGKAVKHDSRTPTYTKPSARK